jgi:hypothetical protein
MNELVAIVQRIEKNKKWTSSILLYILAIVIRDLFQPFHSVATFLYQNTYYLATSLGIALIFAWITKEQLAATSKIVAAGIIFLLIAPFVDMVVLGYSQPGFLIIAAERISDVTLGLQIELMTLLTIAYLYVRIKTNNLLRSVFGALSVGLLIFGLGSIPKMLAWCGLVSAWPFPSLIVLLLGTAILAGVYLYVLLPVASRGFWQYLEFSPVMNYSGLLLLGTVLRKHYYFSKDPIVLLSVVAALSAVIFAYISIRMLEAMAQFPVAKAMNLPSPLTLRQMTMAQTAWVMGISLLVAIMFAFTIGKGILPIILILVFFFTHILLFYFQFLQRIPVVNKILYGGACVWMTFLGYTAMYGSLAGFPMQIAWYFLVFFTLALNLLDIRTQPLDSSCYHFTLPTLIPLSLARQIIGLLVLLAFSIAPWVFRLPFLFPYMIGMGCIELYLIAGDKKYREENIFYIFWLSLGFIIGYYLIHGSPL